jgi:hypothetical protein
VKDCYRASSPRADVGICIHRPADKPLTVPTLVFLDLRERICSVEVGWKEEEALRAIVHRLLAE